MTLTHLMVCLYRGKSNEQIKLEQEVAAPAGAIQLLVILLAELTRTGGFVIELSINQVLEWKGIGRSTNNKKQILEGLAYLDSARFQYRHSRHGWQEARIGTGDAICHRGMLYFQFHRSMYLLIPVRQFMALPGAATARSGRNEPVDTRLFLTWRICQHKRMNLDKPGADRIPVRSLLACCPSIISYRELAQGHVSQRITEPFKNALDKCHLYFSWRFDAEEEPGDYPAFLRSRILIQWAQEDPYPVDERFRRRKAKRRSGASKSGSETSRFVSESAVKNI